MREKRRDLGSIARVGVAAAALVLSAVGALACGPDALGVGRLLAINPGGGMRLGLKSYPQTLDLKDREVVLTFDDGPNPGPTTKILDALAAECVRATFFLIGRNAQQAPAIVRRELKDGHTVAHHSFSHQIMDTLGEAAAKKDIDDGFAADDRAAYSAAGSEPRTPFFRYPGFADTPALNAWLAGRNIAVFGADVWASDWIAMTPKAELDLVLSRLEASKGGVLLMHDSKAQTAAMLPQLLRELKQRGFSVAHLVVGDAPPPLRAAPAGWTSETKTFLKRREDARARRKAPPAAAPPP